MFLDSEYIKIFVFFHFLGCTNFNDELKYLCQWNIYSSALQLISARDAKTNFAHLVVGYLESNLECPPFRYPNAVELMSRALKNSAEVQKISVNSSVKIDRNLGLEKLMLEKSAARIIDRRATVNTGRAVVLKQNTSIPFGARGRKRQTSSLLFIGLQPNPDGRQLVVAGPSTGNVELNITPGRRTYSRATSTPMPSAPLPSADSQPSLVELMNNSTCDAQDTTIEPSFDSTFGFLHYSSSE